MARTPKTPAAPKAKTRAASKAKSAPLAKSPRAPRVKKVAEPIAAVTPPVETVQEAPKPLPGSTNRYSAGSVSPDQAWHYAALATGLELDFGHDEKAMRRYRTRLYAINKEYAGKWRFRTIRDNFVLMIWRLAY